MTKICNRNYSGNSIYTLKNIDGVLCCPLCEKPAICHGKSEAERATFWALSSDTGTSSKSIARHMMGFGIDNDRFYSGPPSDSDDRGRCIRLLELIPEWIPRLPELLENDKPQEGIVISASGIRAETNGWAKQIPLIMREGNL